MHQRRPSITIGVKVSLPGGTRKGSPRPTLAAVTAWHACIVGHWEWQMPNCCTTCRLTHGWLVTTPFSLAGHDRYLPDMAWTEKGLSTVTPPWAPPASVGCTRYTRRPDSVLPFDRQCYCPFSCSHFAWMPCTYYVLCGRRRRAGVRSGNGAGRSICTSFHKASSGLLDVIDDQ